MESPCVCKDRFSGQQPQPLPQPQPSLLPQPQPQPPQANRMMRRMMIQQQFPFPNIDLKPFLRT